ncbi:tryptophan-rich sensory protein [Agromyces sp. MMS24-JH15]|uniref:tryptophan-rich sensory protein n=1 Tax=Agromyces sp. MMS24-JH15 TaxID=3243765 RepID=UPI003748C707
MTVVAASALVAIAGAVVGSGVFGGTPIRDAADGAFASDATLLAPAGPAFAIWTAIYAGLVAYAVWQALPAQRHQHRQRRLGWAVAASMLLNAAWILAVQAGLLALSAVVIVVLLGVLCVAYVRCARTPPHRLREAVVVDGTIGAYLGWVCVATAANVAAVLVAAGFDGWGIPAEAWAIGVIALAAAAVAGLGVVSRGGVAPMLAASWGLAWIAVARLTGEPQSAAVAAAAIVAIVAIAVVTLAARLVSGRNRRLGSPIAGRRA